MTEETLGIDSKSLRGQQGRDGNIRKPGRVGRCNGEMMRHRGDGLGKDTTRQRCLPKTDPSTFAKGVRQRQPTKTILNIVSSYAIFSEHSRAHVLLF